MAWAIVVFLSLFIVVLLIGLGVLGWKAYQWARAVFILEDDLEEAAETLAEAEKMLNQLATMQLFFDSPEVKEVVGQCMDEVKVCKFAINKLSLKFTERSKNRFTYVQDETDPEENAREEVSGVMARKMMTEAPGTPPPLMARQGGSRR